MIRMNFPISNKEVNNMKALELIASAMLTAALVGFCMLGEPIWWVAALATALGILGASLGGLVWRQGRHERR